MASVILSIFFLKSGGISRVWIHPKTGRTKIIKMKSQTLDIIALLKLERVILWYTIKGVVESVLFAVAD